MHRFNRKTKLDVPKKPQSNDGSRNSKSSSGPSSGSSSHQRRPQPKSESDSKSEKSLKDPPPKRSIAYQKVQQSPSPTPKQTNPNSRESRNPVQKIVKVVANRMSITPNRQHQKSTSTPPSSEMRKPSSVKSSDLSDSLDSGPAKRSKSRGNLSNSFSGSNDSVYSDNPRAKFPSKTIKSDRSLIGLDGEIEPENQRRRGSSRKRQPSDSPSSRRDKSMEESASETKDSISLADDEDQRETYRKLFKEFAMDSQKLTLEDFRQEFSELPGDPPSEQCLAFNYGSNAKKNRYFNIPCLDSSRIRLQFLASKSNPASDYIHANHIRSPLLKRGYILTQGPKRETIVDFWRMVWQERSSAIVMLCQFVETNREKCCEYFPRNANSPSLRFDKLTVTFEEATNNKMIVTTRLNLSYDGESRVITHFQWKEWPDYQVPGSSEVMLKILRKIRSRTTPPVIHCAAGVGRSGTLVAIEIALQCINTHFKLPDIKQIVTNLRLTGRASSVQTLQQYMLIWKVLLDFGVSNKLISEDLVAKFATTYQRSLRTNNQS